MKSKKNEEETEQVHMFKSRKAWRDALNNAPNQKWVATRQMGQKESIYVPIQYQQALADVMFDEFDVIDAKYDRVINEIICTVKISILPSYPNAEHRIISGTGAKPIAAVRDSNPAEFPKGKIPNSLEYCAPAARSGAIGNALATFGNVFGRNLGRPVSMSYNLSPKKKEND